MNISIAEQRQIENEMIFRRINEKVGDDLGALDAMHIDDGNLELLNDNKMSLAFKCECSDENCNVRISIPLDLYQEIHTDRDTFVVKTDHQVDPIETVLQRREGFNIVKKNNSTSEPNDILKNTSIDNSAS